MSDLQKFEEQHKESLFQAIGSHLFAGLEDMFRMLGFGKHPLPTTAKSSNQISLSLDKYENKLIGEKK